jgi:hypothetical protein
MVKGKDARTLLPAGNTAMDGTTVALPAVQLDSTTRTTASWRGEYDRATLIGDDSPSTHEMLDGAATTKPYGSLEGDRLGLVVGDAEDVTLTEGLPVTVREELAEMVGVEVKVGDMDTVGESVGEVDMEGVREEDPVGV